MKVEKTFIPGLFILRHEPFKDERGLFAKFFQKEALDEKGLNSEISEVSYSVSKRNVIRGMHFQLPPYDQVKVVTLIKGEITDVILDLRKGSPTFHRFYTINIKKTSYLSIYIPKGCAHGFGVKNDSIIIYLTTSTYNRDSDYGVRYDSFGYNWQLENPVVSSKDLLLPPLSDFNTPFAFGHGCSEEVD